MLFLFIFYHAVVPFHFDGHNLFKSSFNFSNLALFSLSPEHVQDFILNSLALYFYNTGVFNTNQTSDLYKADCIFIQCPFGHPLRSNMKRTSKSKMNE